MSTEYRRGIPSVAHVEAATRLGLLWRAEERPHLAWCFIAHSNEITSAYGHINAVRTHRASLIYQWETEQSYRPIRPDGTPVDWEVFDQEVARVGQQGQPQGFRADLWARVSRHFSLVFRSHNQVSSLTEISNIDDVGIHSPHWQWGWGTADREAPTRQNRADILARWTVYQELKPLYDIVDGGEGYPVMPPEMQQELGHSNLYRSKDNPVSLDRWTTAYCQRVERLIDAVAERRVAARQGQAPAVTSAVILPSSREQHRHDWIYDGLGGGHNGQYVHNCACGESDWFAEPMSAPSPREAVVRPATTQPEPVLNEAALRSLILNLPNVAAITSRIERGSRQRDRYIVRVRLVDPNVPLDRALAAQIPRNVHVHCEGRGDGGQRGVGGAASSIFSPTGNREDAVAPPIPRRFANVRPDRHGWRWWRVQGPGIANTAQIECSNHLGEVERQFRFRGSGFEPWTTFILDRWLDRTVIPTDEQGNPVSWDSIGPITVGTGAKPAQTEAITTSPLPLPRFTADELNDVDHSKTTKLDEVTLRRGKLPTVEQIAKYREVRARRTGGAVADALKESRIDCEVAQYVLERWAGGLGDADTVLLLRAAGCIVPLKDAPQHSIRAFDPKQGEVDRRSQDFLRTHNTTLDTSEKPSPTVQRERQEAEERRQRLVELRQRLAAERAAQPQEMAKESDAVSRFDLIEPDPQADPSASICAREARQAAAKVRPTVAIPRIAKPAAAPRRPAIEVVDAEVDGLSRSEAFTALFGRALNGGC